MSRAVRLVCSIALLAIAILAAAPRAAFALYPHKRGGWEAGVGYGLGYGKIWAGSGLKIAETDWIDGACPQIRIAKFLNPHLSIGYYQQEWMDVKGYGDTQIFVSLQNFTAAMTVYPGNPDHVTGGLYMRGAVGFSNGRLDVAAKTGSNLDTTSASTYRNEGGLGVSAAIGYELRIFKSVAFGGEASAQYQTIDQAYFKETWYFPACLTLSWYF
jgi:hypothetical protein